MPEIAVRLLFVILLAAVAAGCGSSVDDPTDAAASGGAAEATTTTAAPMPSTSPSTTSTTSVYESLGEEVAVSESVLGTVTWRRASSIPAQLLLSGDLPGPTHHWEYDWLGRYENAYKVTGSCFEIYEEAAGYLGLGPCPLEWAPWAPADDPYRESSRAWGFPWAGHPQYPVWIWMTDVWFSPDGESWENTTKSFPDATAVVAAEPWSVTERGGRWVVIGATGVGENADPGRIPWEERTYEQKYYGNPWLWVPRSAEPAAWVSDDLSDWSPVAADFATEGMDTRLSSVVAGDSGWMIFGVRSSQEKPRITEWAAWVSVDGITWEELSMGGVYDTPCEPSIYEHCGMIKAHMLEDAIVAYAWTWPLHEGYMLQPGWRLLVGTF